MLYCIVNIRYITPFSTDRNIGKAYNEVISEFPDDCYIVLRDGDTMFLTPDWGHKIKQIIIDNPDYSVITCMTNRISLRDLLWYGEFMEGDMHKQISIAETSWNDHNTKVTPTDCAPGMLMIFHKSVWKQNKFQERTIIFDRLFSESVLSKGGKIGVAKGLYIFHLYRYNQENPITYNSHLL